MLEHFCWLGQGGQVNLDLGALRSKGVAGQGIAQFRHGPQIAVK